MALIIHDGTDSPVELNASSPKETGPRGPSRHVEDIGKPVDEFDVRALDWASRTYRGR